MRKAGLDLLSPRLAMLTAASAAITADEEQAAGLFDEALAIPGAERWPFELARVRLAYGEHLRRSHRTSASRLQLATALDTFHHLGAAPWAARAANELRATGQSTPWVHPSPQANPLTPQEYEIAALAASGLTNRQIGAQLFLSHRTVGAHLYRIFPKLGITTRGALRDALTGLPRQEPS
jgi:DNA-binding CsgD family transcriptional regulator